LIDVGQAVVLEHPMAQELFVRDLRTIAAYFKRKGAGFDWEAVHKQILTHGATGKGVVFEEE
jgi:serine/threonine-protein kinase RIO1